MAVKNGKKTIFGKSRQQTAHTLWVKNFFEIALSRTVPDINAFLHFTQKFNDGGFGGKTILI